MSLNIDVTHFKLRQHVIMLSADVTWNEVLINSGMTRSRLLWFHVALTVSSHFLALLLCSVDGAASRSVSDRADYRRGLRSCACTSRQQGYSFPRRAETTRR
jgi:hypothetical protein